MPEPKQSDLAIVPAMAAAVPISASLQLAEAGIAALRKRHREISDEQGARIREYRSKSNSAGGAQINATAIILTDLERQITDLRADVSKLRLERAARVADALGPIRKDAAGRVLAAIHELHCASDILIGANEEIRKAGNPDIGFLSRAPVASLVEHATRLLR